MCVEARVTYTQSGEDVCLGSVAEGAIGIYQDFSPDHSRLLAVRCEPLRTSPQDIAARVAIIDNVDFLDKYNQSNQQDQVGLIWGALMAMHESQPIGRGFGQEYDIWTSGSPRSCGRLLLQHLAHVALPTPRLSTGGHLSREQLIAMQLQVTAAGPIQN